ncbi:other/Haspin protein kinase [Mycena pura]|uniref:non-specific serine/threonine protein kinase n=1 Tax=Mycena pura TaxID=153505 RepID=A0AAD6YT47_9AGAR|nr:other/Haspin protein kinase [Mycena pura]
MLGSRTKQVTTYGKRRQRIVGADDERHPRPPPTIFDDLPPPVWAPVVSRMKKRSENAHQKPKSKSRTPSPKILHMRKKRLSPPRKALPQIRRLEVEMEVFTPPRRPLGLKALNTPGSPPLLAKGKCAPRKGTPSFNDIAPSVDFVVLDDQGKTLTEERKASRPRIASESDSDDDVPPQPMPPRRLRRLASKRVDSDESDSEDISGSMVQRVPHYTSISAGVNVTKPPERVEPRQLQPEVVLTRRPRLPTSPAKLSLPVVIPLSTAHPLTPPLRRSIPSQPLRYQPIPSPIPRPRQLTPIGGRSRSLYAPPSPPSPLTQDDVDLTLDLSDLSISLSSEAGGTALAQEIPEYLQPLLAECGQSKDGLHEFSAFIKSFPYDSLVSAHPLTPRGFKKIGEASYSEVYGIGDVVLKVIPLRDESQRQPRTSACAEEPFATDAKDVLKEVIVTQAMGEVCDGFVKLLRTYIVRGTYPQVLLELWDEYHRLKGSEGVRPDTFAVSQAYAIIVLPNGGPDLEAYKFASKGGWKQACSIFWQVAKALAHAEQLVSFEHRDLHLGQILVKESSILPRPLQPINQNHKVGKASRPTMDDPVHGVRVTLIDLGLARMDAGDGCGGEMVHWTPFEDEIFEGEGDYQFDIYRYMRNHNGHDWEAFNPLTNAMWLHYLAVKMIKFKGLRAPARRKSQAPTAPGVGFTDRDCYECMLDIEEWLGNCVATVVAEAPKGANAHKGRGSKKKGPSTAAPMPTPAGLLRGPLCAGEVVGYGVKKRWIRSLEQAIA